MARYRKNLEKFKNSSLVFISGLAFVVIVWLLFYGKVKAVSFLAPLLGKVPRSESGLIKATEDVLGTAMEKVRGEDVQKAVKKGSEVFESSDYAEPVRGMRDEVKRKIDETIESAKGLPAKEVRHIQVQVCKEWLGEEMIATESGTR